MEQNFPYASVLKIFKHWTQYFSVTRIWIIVEHCRCSMHGDYAPRFLRQNLPKHLPKFCSWTHSKSFDCTMNISGMKSSMSKKCFRSCKKFNGAMKEH